MVLRVYFEKYGCSLNQAETVNIVENYLSMGYELTDNPEKADRIVIGTCVVIQHTENQMVRRVRELSEYGRPVIVYGCLPTVREERLRGIENVYPVKIHQDNFPDGKITWKNPVFVGETTYTIPIAQGCTGSCSYCISKFSRGYIKSMDISWIIERIRLARDKGYREIRLTALDSAAYGTDINRDLSDLLNTINNLEGDFRIRVGMMEPSNMLGIMDRLLESFRSEKVFKFFHVPFQSGNDRILELMNRKYTARDSEFIINKIRENFDYYTLSTDIITGFPGEDDDAFEDTVKLIEKIEPDILNITRFSPRPGTQASKMKMVKSMTSKERSLYLTDLHRNLSLKRNSMIKDMELDVIVTEKGKKGFLGRTEFYRPVVLENAVIGKWYKVYIEDVSPYYLKGRIISEKVKLYN